MLFPLLVSSQPELALTKNGAERLTYKWLVENVAIGLTLTSFLLLVLAFQTKRIEKIFYRLRAIRTKVRLPAFEYIEGWNNRRRSHSSLNYQPLLNKNLIFYTSPMAA